jgi:hypothetical protein
MVLAFSRDNFDGVLISPDGLPTDPSAFGRALTISLEHWTAQGRDNSSPSCTRRSCDAAEPAAATTQDSAESRPVRGVWLTLRTTAKHAALLPMALSAGFQVHHATPDNIVLLLWVPTALGLAGDPCVVPPFCHTYTGCGAVCIDTRGRLLAIREKWGAWTKWKLPGGHVDLGETVLTAVRRELWEETGVEGTPLAVVSFRSQQNFVFGQDDVYFGCLMVPKDPGELAI